MDVRFCERRDHGREAPTRAEDLDRQVHALESAPGHVCFSLTEDLHGCQLVKDSKLLTLPRCSCAFIVHGQEERS